MIYLDNAATTLAKPPQVAKAIVAALSSAGNAGRGAHAQTLAASRIDFELRQELAEFFGVNKSERVCFTQNSTAALNTALFGLVAPGARVITTVTEHNSVLRPLYRLQKERGAELCFVSADSLGRINYDELDALLARPADLVVVNHASNVTGNLADLSRISRAAHAAGATLVVDASQTAGVVPLNMAEQGIDVLCFTGHKSLMGPQGTGGLCVGEGIEIAPFMVGGTGVQSFSTTQPESYPTRLEAGTLNSHGLAGLLASVRFIKEVGVAAIAEHETALMLRFYEQVRMIPGIRIYGDICSDPVPERCAVVSLNVGELSSSVVSDVLATHFGIATRPGAHCAPLMHKALGTTTQGCVRFSFGYYNTADEVDAAASALAQIAS